MCGYQCTLLGDATHDEVFSKAFLMRSRRKAGVPESSEDRPQLPFARLPTVCPVQSSGFWI